MNLEDIIIKLGTKFSYLEYPMKVIFEPEIEKIIISIKISPKEDYKKYEKWVEENIYCNSETRRFVIDFNYLGWR